MKLKMCLIGLLVVLILGIFVYVRKCKILKGIREVKELEKLVLRYCNVFKFFFILVVFEL